MLIEIPKLWLDAAGTIAAFFAALPYLVSPETTSKIIPRFLAQHRKIISPVAALACFVIVQTRPWAHTQVPVWIPLDIAVLVVGVLLTVQGWRTSHPYKIPNYVPSEGVIWEIRGDTVVPDPACGKCHTRMLLSTSAPGANPCWQCSKCGAPYEWDNMRGSPQDAAAELVNSELRKRNMSAVVIGWVEYYG